MIELQKIIGYLHEICCQILNQKFHYLRVFSDRILPKYSAIFGQNIRLFEYYSDSRKGNESNTNINICEEIFDYIRIFVATLYFTF